MKVTIDIEISDQSCADIMCTALEGGIGYWCIADDVRRTERGKGEHWDYVSFDAWDAEDDDTPCFGTVTYDVIRLGVQRLLEGGVKIRPDLLAQVQTITHGEGNEDIDADAADCIVQAGLFNDLVYG